MAVRVKDRIEGNIRQSDKVNNSLSINGKTFNGSIAVDAGVIGAAYGGTGQTTLINSANALINALGIGTSTPIDQDYYISQYVGGGTTTTTFHRRPHLALYTYIKNRAEGTWGINITGNAATATTCTGNAATATRLVDNGDHTETASGTTANAPSTGMLYSSGLYMTRTYTDSATPVSYGNIINLAGLGTGQLLCEWSGSDNTSGHLYYRSHRDTSTGGWAPWVTILDNNNYTNYFNPANYVLKTGDTMTGKLQVNDLIVGYNYSKAGNNAAAFMFDKPSTNWTGIGACGENDTIYFGACSASGAWVTDYRQKWKFNGSLIVGGGDDSCNIVPWTNNYSTIGTDSLRWWKIFATTFYEDGTSLTNKYLALSGGTITGPIIKENIGGTWVTGRDRAALKNTSCTESAGNSWKPLISWKSPSGSFEMGVLSGYDYLRVIYVADANYTAGDNTSTTCGYFTSEGVFYGAAWNDYAEFRTTATAKAGEVVVENGNGTMHRSYKRLEPAASIVSDTYGFAIGETEKCGTPIAVAGRVLAYPYEDRYSYKAGDAVCSAPDGKVSKMTREEMVMYPDCIIGYVSEIPEYEVWGQTDVPVDGRIWIKV